MEGDEAYHGEEPHDVLCVKEDSCRYALQDGHIIALRTVAFDHQRIITGIVWVKAMHQIGVRRRRWRTREVLVVGATQQLGEAVIAFVLLVRGMA